MLYLVYTKRPLGCSRPSGRERIETAMMLFHGGSGTVALAPRGERGLKLGDRDLNVGDRVLLSPLGARED